MPDADPLPPEPPLHRAARVGDHAALLRLFDSGADIETRAIPAFERGTEGLTPLMVAACSVDGASVATLALLLEGGADLRATSHSSTAAWYAAGGDGGYENPSDRNIPDRVDRLRYLLNAGLDAREGDDDRRALISQAARVGDPARVRLLLARGASPLGDEWVIPLFKAAASGSAECVRLLLNAGADPNGLDWFGQPALASARSPEVVAVLLAAGAKLDWRNSQEDLLDAVFTAITDADPPFTQGFAVAEALLHAGLSLDKIDSQGWSRLAFAAFREQAAVVEFLLSRGVSLANDNEGSTLLHWVCWQGEHDPEIDAACERIIRGLVAAGISVDARTRRQRTPLHEAVTGDWGKPNRCRDAPRARRGSGLGRLPGSDPAASRRRPRRNCLRRNAAPGGGESGPRRPGGHDTERPCPSAPSYSAPDRLRGLVAVAGRGKRAGATGASRSRAARGVRRVCLSPRRGSAASPAGDRRPVHTNDWRINRLLCRNL